MNLRYFYNPIKSYYRPNRKHSSIIKAIWKMLKSMWSDIYIPLRFWMKRMDERFLDWEGTSKPAPDGTIDMRTMQQFDNLIGFLYCWNPKEVYLFVNHKYFGEHVMVFHDDDIPELKSFAKKHLILRET